MNDKHDVVDFYVCPKCKGNLIFLERNIKILCEDCNLVFECHKGNPILKFNESIRAEENIKFWSQRQDKVNVLTKESDSIDKMQRRMNNIE